MSYISISGVSKIYLRGQEPVEVLRDVDLAVEKGAFAALMGPSGSGKTTLLNILGGIDVPTAGQVVVGGQRIDHLVAGELSTWRSRTVGCVFQFYNLMPSLSARKNVELPLLLTNLSRLERARRAETALSLVGLAERGGHKPNELSGGQQQRVAIARAIVADPELLICDEPTGDLDRRAADEVLALLRVLNRELGKTIVMVTHDPKAAAYADYTLTIDKGVVSGAGGARRLSLCGADRSAMHPKQQTRSE